MICLSPVIWQLNMEILGSLIPALEIFVISIVFNYLFSFFWNTRSMDLVVGVLVFLMAFALIALLHLPILYTIMTNLANVAILAILIIFQPELRVALSKFNLKGRQYRNQTEFDQFLDILSNAVYRLAEKKIGALITLECEDTLEEFTQKGILLHAKFSSELLETIFSVSTPLHDGSIIIGKDSRIIAAAVILPLAVEVAEMAPSMGTRHRAALGISQLTDAVAIAISEKHGTVSLAKEGVLSQKVKIGQFKGLLSSFFISTTQPSLFTRKFKFRTEVIQ